MELLSGPLVRAARVLLGWRQEDLAEKIGKAAITVRLYENGRIQSAKTSAAIEKVYKASGIKFTSRCGVITITIDTNATMGLTRLRIDL